MAFEFSTAGRVIFGAGRLREVPELMRGWGSRVLVVTGRSASRVRPLVQGLEGAGFEPRLMSVQGEPTVEMVVEGCRLALEQRVEVVVALGGGSALDAGKAIAGLVTNPGDPLDYLEVVGRGRPLLKPGLPFVAIPTTAGTGTEVTRNAVLSSAEHRVKVSLRSNYLLPRLAVVDPELSYGLGPRLTAATGLDALTQLIEPFVSGRANALTDGLCREGLVRVARSVRLAHEVAKRVEGDLRPDLRGEERKAREDMAVAACFGGMALANAGLGAVHGFAGPIGGAFPAPHGEVCAILLPHVIEENVRALQAREPGNPALERYREVAGLLTGHADASLREGLAWVQSLVLDLHIPTLSEHGIAQGDIPLLVEKAQRASSMKANPIVLSTDELARVLSEAL
jgi:alcohol dehydrogenase class IV